MNEAPGKSIEVVPLTKHIGAEIRGVDLSKPVDTQTQKAIYQAWLEHIVIVFRGQKLTQEDHMRATKMFGEPGHIHRPPKYRPAGFDRVLPGIMFISNIRENGEPIGALPDGEMMFHHDPALRNKLEGRKARHHYNYGSVVKGDGKGTEAFGESEHPFFRTHDQTGKKAIYVNRLMTVGIEGMSDEEAQPILDHVFDHMEKEEFVYAHKWQVGDILLWDNRCSTHARTDFPADQRRLMLRTTVECAKPPY